MTKDMVTKEFRCPMCNHKVYVCFCGKMLISENELERHMETECKYDCRGLVKVE